MLEEAVKKVSLEINDNGNYREWRGSQRVGELNLWKDFRYLGALGMTNWSKEINIWINKAQKAF